MQYRLKEIRKHSGLTQDKFASELGATRGMIAMYETGRNVPPPATRMLICQKFSVNLEWLETGEGKPYKEGLMPELVHALRQMPSVHAALERLLPVMTDADWRALDDMVYRFLNSKPPD